MLRILIIDDDEMLRELLAVSLQLDGHEVVAVEHGAAGMDALEWCGGVDLIIVDLMMPVMDGLRFMRRLKDRAQPTPPVIVLSAVGQQGRERELEAAGARAVIRKPVDVPELLAKVQDVLRRAA